MKEKEFHIPMTKQLEEELEHMCNLSDGVEQKGIEKGIEKERIRAIQRKLEKNKTVEEIAEELEISVDEVKVCLENIEKA